MGIHILARLAFSRSTRSCRSFCSNRISSTRAFFSTEVPADSATIIQGPSLLTATGVHRPSPSLFHLPGLRSLPFWTAPENPSAPQDSHQQRRHRIAFDDPVVSAAVNHLESNFGDIRSEYFSAVLGQGNQMDLDNGSANKPLEPDYDVSSKGGEHADEKLHEGSWDWHSYILNGVRNETFRERCPKTSQVIDDIEKEGMLFGTPFGFCFFSTLHGKSSIRAHSGPMNLRLRVHLPIMVPKETSSLNNNAERDRPTTGIKIADQIRVWHEGSALVLDDSYVHEVWNDAEEPRVLLLLDLWHPDVKIEERAKITNMFDYARGQGWIGKRK